MKIKCLSIVIPCHNEAKNVELLTEKIYDTLSSCDFSFELIFVDDGSTDKTFLKLEELSINYPAIKGISLSRNFGHQMALFAGLEQAKGDVIVTMDADLQHPPYVIHQLIETYYKGFDIVNTKRQFDETASFFKKKSSVWFYALINKLSEIKVAPLSADFRLMNRETVDAFLKLREHDRFTRGLVSWIGFKQAIVTYKAEPRHAGKTSYTYSKMIKLAISGITSMSSKPLRLSLYLGFLLLVSGFLYTCYILYNYFMGVTVPGWTSILISVLIIGGVQLFILSIIGEYIAQIYNESKSRPLYLIKKTINLEL